jgi:hypothetical protein
MQTAIVEKISVDKILHRIFYEQISMFPVFKKADNGKIYVDLKLGYKESDKIDISSNVNIDVFISKITQTIILSREQNFELCGVLKSIYEWIHNNIIITPSKYILDILYYSFMKVSFYPFMKSYDNNDCNNAKLYLCNLIDIHNDPKKFIENKPSIIIEEPDDIKFVDSELKYINDINKYKHYFITITSSDKVDEPLDKIKLIAHTIIASKMSSMEKYAYVIELQKNGTPHIHMEFLSNCTEVFTKCLTKILSKNKSIKALGELSVDANNGKAHSNNYYINNRIDGKLEKIFTINVKKCGGKLEETLYDLVKYMTKDINITGFDSYKTNWISLSESYKSFKYVTKYNLNSSNSDDN